MNTMIGYSAHEAADNTGKILNSLLWLMRNFLSQTDTSVQTVNANQLLQNVPARVWKRHSALLTLLAEQADKATTG